MTPRDSQFKQGAGGWGILADLDASPHPLKNRFENLEKQDFGLPVNTPFITALYSTLAWVLLNQDSRWNALRYVRN